MAYQWSDNHSYTGIKPDFERQYYETIEDMKAVKKLKMPQMYIAMCRETGLIYLYNKDNDEDETLGLWREFQGGSGGQEIQVEELPTASSANVGNIYQYIGETDDTYTNGYFYKCVNNEEIYSWENINIQPSGGIEIETEDIDFNNF